MRYVLPVPCPSCGNDLGASTQTCDVCGHRFHTGACGRCGWYDGEVVCLCLLHQPRANRVDGWQAFFGGDT